MKKKNIILLSILVVVCFGYGILFYFLTGSNKATEGYLIVSSLGGYYCKASTCSYKKIEEMNLENRNIRIFQQNQFKGIYQLQYIDRFNFFQNGSWQNFYGDFLGVDESLNAHIMESRYEPMNSSDYAIINQVASNHQISSYSFLDNNQSLVVDLDQNGVEDRFLFVSNQNEERKEDVYFSCLLLVLNGKVQEIYFDKSIEQTEIPYYQVFSMFSLDEEKKSRILVHKSYYDQSGEPSLVMLQLDGKKVKEIVSDSAKK